MTVLVTGATGTVGSQVVRELAERGETVRAFVRDPDKARQLLGADVDLAIGDFADAGSLARALRGTDRLFLACANVPDQVGYECGAIDAAAEAGVRRIVKLSGPRADTFSALIFERWHGMIEHRLVGSGVPWVILRPRTFQTLLLADAGTIQATGRLFAPAGAAVVTFVDPADVAASAAAALLEDDAANGHEGGAAGEHGDGVEGRVYELTGPQALTYDDIAQALSEVTGRAVEYVDVPDGAARQGLLAAGMPEVVADFVVGYFATLRAGGLSNTTDDVRRLTGRDPRSVAEFLRLHADAFGSGPAARRHWELSADR